MNNECKQIWPNAKSKPVIGPRPLQFPPFGPTTEWEESVLAATSTSVWKNNFGINTHCSQVQLYLFFTNNDFFIILFN